MPEGVFQTDRIIFDSPIWENPAKFRLFFYIYGNAIFSKEGVDIGGIHLSRGQLLKSYRKLSDELEYIENHSLKKYSISHIKKLIGELVKEKRLEMEVSQLGTLFTVLNYEQYQGFERFEKDNREQSENTTRTLRERNENNNKNDKNDKNVKKDIYGEKVHLSESEYAKLIVQHGETETNQMISILDNWYLTKGNKPNKSDYHTMVGVGWVLKRFKEDQQRRGNKDPGDKPPKSPSDKYDKFYL